MISLRDFTENEIEDEVRWMTVDTDWMKFAAPWEKTASGKPEDIRKKMQDIVASGSGDFVKSRKEIFADDRHIGFISLHTEALPEYPDLNETAASDATAICIGLCEPDCTGRGYETEILKKALDYCFRHGIKRVFLAVHVNNESLLSCAEKCNFEASDSASGQSDADGNRKDFLLLQFKAAAESEAQWYMTKSSGQKMPAYKKAVIVMTAFAAVLFLVAAFMLM